MLKFVDISATTLTLVAGLEIKKYISNVIEKIKDQSKSPIDLLDFWVVLLPFVTQANIICQLLTISEFI